MPGARPCSAPNHTPRQSCSFSPWGINCAGSHRHKGAEARCKPRKSVPALHRTVARCSRDSRKAGGTWMSVAFNTLSPTLSLELFRIFLIWDALEFCEHVSCLTCLGVHTYVGVGYTAPHMFSAAPSTALSPFVLLVCSPNRHIQPSDTVTCCPGYRTT